MVISRFCGNAYVYACAAVCVSLVAGITPKDYETTRDRKFCEPGQDCYPTNAEFRKLREKLDGRLLFENNADYHEECKMYNEHEQVFPKVIVMVANERDIRRAILFAKKNNLRVTVRSSGHSYIGRSTAPKSFMINLSEMDEYSINLEDKRHDGGTLRTPTGIPWIKIYEALDQVRRTIVGGTCPSVTAGGYTLGGGHSALSRSYGYAVDNLLEARLVLADGSYATCTEKKTVIERVDGSRLVIMNGDLFWALKGGGGNAFGIVVHFVFKIHRLPEHIVLSVTAVPFEAAIFPHDIKDEVFQAFFNLYRKLPADWNGYWITDNFPNGSYTPVDYPFPYKGHLHVSLIKNAAWDGSEPELLSEFINLANSYGFVSTFVNLTGSYQYQRMGANLLRTSENTYMFSTLIQPEFMDMRIFEWYKSTLFAHGQTEEFICNGVLLGGATTEPAVSSSALHKGFRTASTALICSIELTDNQMKNARLIRQADKMAAVLKTFGDGMYFNEPHKNRMTWKEDYWGIDKYDRLLRIKNKYDPDNFLTCYHCVGSDGLPPSDDSPLVPAA